MADKTNITWADATFNPWLGCTKISPACDNCYAQTLVEGRFKTAQWGAGKPRIRTSAANWRKPLAWDRAAKVRASAWQHGIDLHGGDEAACIAAGFIKPQRPQVFCASLADVFDNAVDPVWRIDLFDLIRDTPHLDWLLLTKRIGNAHEMLNDACAAVHGQLDCWAKKPLPNVWLGATICNQEEADRDIPKLLAIPAAKRFLSIEPMLGPIDLEKPMHGPDLYQGGGGSICQPWVIQSGIDWVICGGESGKNARPMHTAWVRSLRNQCATAGVAFHFKQWGEWLPKSQISADLVKIISTTHWTYSNRYEVLYKVGTKAAGRTLDGAIHNAVPN